MPKSKPRRRRKSQSRTPNTQIQNSITKPESREADAYPLERPLRFSASLTTHFRGPLPPPELLEAYESTVPGISQTIVEVFVKETEHRREIERKDINTERLGVVCAFVLTLSGLVGGVFTIYLGHVISGSLLTGAALVPIVGTFIRGTRRQKNGKLSEPTKSKP